MTTLVWINKVLLIMFVVNFGVAGFISGLLILAFPALLELVEDAFLITIFIYLFFLYFKHGDDWREEIYRRSGYHPFL